MTLLQMEHLNEKGAARHVMYA